MAEFRMPSLGADMETGTVYDWRVKPGDKVGRGDIIVTVETDKGAIDVEIFEEGVISEILVPEGTEVPVGTVLALLNGGAGPPAPQPQPTAVTPKREEPAHPMDQRPLVTSQPVTPVTNGRRLRISPAARRRAEELGLDLHTLKRTGPAGAISLADVERAASQADAQGREHAEQPGGARVDRHGVGHADEPGDPLLELLGHRAHRAQRAGRRSPAGRARGRSARGLLQRLLG